MVELASSGEIWFYVAIRASLLDVHFSAKLLGDITAVKHGAINHCCSGLFFLINCSILKSNSVKLKLLMK